MAGYIHSQAAMTHQDEYFHVTRPGVSPGDVLPRGSYGRSLEAEGMSATNDPLQEHLRETVRQESYTTKPSRLTSSFVFETFEDAIFFRDKFRHGMSVYQVRFLKPPSSVHRVCYTAWDENFPNPRLQAHNFWCRPPLYSSNTELFAEEDLVVIIEIVAA